MNRKFVSGLAFGAVAVGAAAAIAVVSRTAYAEGLADYAAPFVSSTTREQVQSDLKARPDRFSESEWIRHDNQPRERKSAYTIDEVRSAYRASRAETQALTGEDSGSFYFNGMKGRRTGAVMGAPAR